LAAFDTGDVLTLHRALGLKPWESSPLGVNDGPAPEWVSDADWKQAQALRRALTELLRS
jgi:hypothetical protein